MGKMVLAVIVLPPGLVCLLDLWSGARVGKRMVSEPSLNGEQGFRVNLPGLAWVNALFTDTKHVVELESLRAVKLPSTIGHKGFWCPVAPNRISQDREVVRATLQVTFSRFSRDHLYLNGRDFFA